MIDPSSFYTAYRVTIWLSAVFARSYLAVLAAARCDRRPSKDALARAAEWNALFAGTAFGFKGRTVHATFPAGIAVYPDNAQYRTALLEATDIALYDAKARGRNQVCRAA